jgi:hypothetical protein
MVHQRPVADRPAGDAVMMLGQPCPGAPCADVPDRPATYAQVGSNGPARSRVGADCAHHVRCQHGVGVGCAPRHSGTLRRVPSVVCDCSVPQVRRLDTFPAIARVEHPQVARPVVALCHDTVRPDLTRRLGFDPPVPVGSDEAGEDEAVPVTPYLIHHDVVGVPPPASDLPRCVHVCTALPARPVAGAPRAPAPRLSRKAATRVFARFAHWPILPGTPA